MKPKGLLASYATILEVFILNIPLSIYGKTEKDFLIVACIIAAETRLLLLGNFETKARNLAMKPKGLLASYATILEVFILNIPLSIYGKTEKDFLIVACIIAAETRLLLLGNFETKARNLAKRPKVYWRPMLL